MPIDIPFALNSLKAAFDAYINHCETDRSVDRAEEAFIACRAGNEHMRESRSDSVEAA